MPAISSIILWGPIAVWRGGDAQLASLSSDNVISRQLVNVLDTLHLHTSSHITASSRITAHHHALPRTITHYRIVTVIAHIAHSQTHTFRNILDTSSFL